MITYSNQSGVVTHNKYVDKVLRSDSFEALWWLFKDAEKPVKEITESYAAFSNMKKVCRVHDYIWMHIGDGAYTRTSGIFTFFSKCKNISIDPAIKTEKYKDWLKKFRVKNITVFKEKFEDIAWINFYRPYNICCVHSHVDLEKVDKKFSEWNFLYTNYCCYPTKQTFSKKYMEENNIEIIVEKVDLGIHTDKRNVIIYKNNRI